MGAFLTTSSSCVPVNYPLDPDPPFVSLIAPDAVGNCDDLTLEGSASFTSLGTPWPSKGKRTPLLGLPLGAAFANETVYFLYIVESYIAILWCALTESVVWPTQIALTSTGG